MKRNIAICVLLAAVTAGGTDVRADGGGSFDQPGKDKACCCPEREERMPPPPSLKEQIDHMARQLSLTNAQQAKIKALFVKDNEKVEPLWRKLTEYRTQLETAMKSAPFDETAIRTIAARKAQIEVDLTVSRARLQSQVNALLTPEQRLRAEKLPPPFRHGHGPRPMRGDEGGLGHMPPPPCGDQWSSRPDAESGGE